MSTPEIYIHYVFSRVSEELLRQKIGSLLEGANISKVTLIPRRNPTGYDYQSARITVDWDGKAEADDGAADGAADGAGAADDADDKEKASDLAKIKQALEDGKQIRVDYDTREETPKYWILVKHRETVIPKPTYELLENTKPPQDDSETSEDDEEFPDLYIHYVFSRLNTSMITKTLSSLIPGVEFTIEKTWDRTTKKGQEFKSVRINASYKEGEETDETGKEIYKGFADGKILRVNYDVRQDTPRFWLVTRNRRFQQTTPSFKIMTEVEDGEEKE